MTAANKIQNATTEAQRKERELIYFVVVQTVHEFIESKLSEASTGFEPFPIRFTRKDFSKKFFDIPMGVRAFRRFGFTVNYRTERRFFFKKDVIEISYT